MSWDKRATTRQASRPSGERTTGMAVVYLGLTDQAAQDGVADAATLRIGDSFRLLPGAAITFGRDKLCEITIDSLKLEPAHAVVALLAGEPVRLALIDLGSREGTWVHGHVAPVHLLEAGGELVLAQAFRFRCQPAS